MTTKHRPTHTHTVASTNPPPLLFQQQAGPERDRRPQRWADEHAEEDLLRRGRRDEEDHQQGLVRVPGEEAQRRRHDGPLSCALLTPSLPPSLSLGLHGNATCHTRGRDGPVRSEAGFAVV